MNVGLCVVVGNVLNTTLTPAKVKMSQKGQTKKYFLVCNKKSRFDFADELKVGDVRYIHLTETTIKVQLF